MKFDEFKLNPDILSGLGDVHLDEPTSLQQSILPAILEGKDVFAKADAGNSKITAISIAALQQFSVRKQKETTSVLVLTPDAKQAKEIDEQIWAMGYHAQVESACIDSDSDKAEQEKAILNKVPVIVANPDQLLNILQDQRIIFRQVEFIVIDALDEMIAMKLQEQLKAIKKRILNDVQVLLFTNDYNNEVKNLAKVFVDKVEIIGFEEMAVNGSPLQSPPAVDRSLSQGYIYVPSRMKITTLMAHIEQSSSDRCVVFTASKRGTDRLYKILRKSGLKVTSIHSKLGDEKRSQRFGNFTSGNAQYLLVAEISAAELDLNNVDQVINYDVPNDVAEYRYRANLVGAGKAKRIVSLVSKQDQSDISQLKNELGQAPEELPLPNKVKQKLKDRKNNEKTRRDTRKHRPKSGKSKNRAEKKELELPRPSYDKLSGGRSGDTDERTGVVEFFKKLFS